MKKNGRPCVKKCISCPVCKKEFNVHRYRLKTGKPVCCSMECKYKFASVNGRSSRKCIQCGDRFSFKKSEEPHRPKIYCSQACYNIVRNKSGKPPMFPYRKLAFEKLPNHCYFCSKEENLHVHHIDEDRNNNKLSNLVILCCGCHSKIHFLHS